MASASAPAGGEPLQPRPRLVGPALLSGIAEAGPSPPAHPLGDLGQVGGKAVAPILAVPCGGAQVVVHGGPAAARPLEDPGDVAVERRPVDRTAVPPLDDIQFGDHAGGVQRGVGAVDAVTD